MYNDPDPQNMSTPISQAIDRYGAYANMVHFYSDSKPLNYESVLALPANTFLANISYALLVKRFEQEMMNKQKMDQKIKDLKNKK